MGFRANLNFRKFDDKIMDFIVTFLNYKYLKLKLRVLIAGRTVAMVTY